MKAAAIFFYMYVCLFRMNRDEPDVRVGPELGQWFHIAFNITKLLKGARFPQEKFVNMC